jgi:hypothetical protein
MADPTLMELLLLSRDQAINLPVVHHFDRQTVLPAYSDSQAAIDRERLERFHLTNVIRRG